MNDGHSCALTLFLVDQDDAGGQQRSQIINIPVEAAADGDSVGSAMVDQLRNSLQSLDKMRERFVEERNQWNAERDQLKTSATEVFNYLFLFNVYFAQSSSKNQDTNLMQGAPKNNPLGKVRYL